jgi:DnaJ-class molecular chaperone
MAQHGETPERNPGDQAKPGTPGSGENICPVCHGTGRLQDGAPCGNCGGSGKIIEGIGGG